MSRRINLPMHEEISIRGERFMRRLQNADFLQKRTSVLAPFSPISNRTKSADEIHDLKNATEQTRAIVNRRLSMPYWRSLQQQKIRGY